MNSSPRFMVCVLLMAVFASTNPAYALRQTGLEENPQARSELVFSLNGHRQLDSQFSIPHNPFVVLTRHVTHDFQRVLPSRVWLKAHRAILQQAPLFLEDFPDWQDPAAWNGRRAVIRKRIERTVLDYVKTVSFNEQGHRMLDLYIDNPLGGWTRAYNPSQVSSREVLRFFREDRLRFDRESEKDPWQLIWETIPMVRSGRGFVALTTGRFLPRLLPGVVKQLSPSIREALHPNPAFAALILTGGTDRISGQRLFVQAGLSLPQGVAAQTFTLPANARETQRFWDQIGPGASDAVLLNSEIVDAGSIGLFLPDSLVLRERRLPPPRVLYIRPSALQRVTPTQLQGLLHGASYIPSHIVPIETIESVYSGEYLLVQA